MAQLVDEGVLTSRERPGPKLYRVEVMPEGTPRMLVGLVHGYADHAARYSHVMQHLAEHGIGCVAIDLRGHGRAEGPRGHVGRFQEYVDDIAELGALLRTAAERTGASDAPRVLYGHSMGGLGTFHAALEAKPGTWQALVHTSPFFGLKLEVPWAKRAAAKLATKLYPKLALPTGLAGKDLTHDQDIAQKYDNDPLGFKKATAGWFSEVIAAQSLALERASELRLPYWVCHGEDDPVANPSASRRLFDRISSERKHWQPAPKLLHEVFNEPSWRELVDAMTAFLDPL